MVKVAGIDPGRSGSIAIIAGSDGARRSIKIFDLPFNDDGLDHRAYRDILVSEKPDFAYIESVWPRSARAPNAVGGMGIISASKFMRSTGAIEGITACFVPDCYKVVPQSWKREFSLLKTTKADSRKMFAMLWPEHAHLVKLVKWDGRAEAGLIGTYGAIRQGIFKVVQG